MPNDNNNQHVDELTELSMNIILHAGNARKHVMDALVEVETENHSKAEELLELANQEIVTAHRLQTSTLQKEAEGEQIRYSTLFSHAQDTLMTTKSELLLSERFISIIKRIQSKREG
ncbi:PTS lactose transporter subunit IIA [Lentibacillus populi]|uniref:PTS lactose transporter subunit IIA n=1 Tax=Lentibacillus populi TaxID=1827502 RepID=A0A9W5TWT6_9BACI|nr:PTS lactose/cellobiose transporter subunit IIA [Lentibacillus populi]GGB38901.1 PTS lactose transporter subunit IIA [Lentibacillus populi]